MPALSRRFAAALAAVACSAAPAWTASISGSLAAAAAAASRHPVVCADDGSGAPASLVVQVSDDAPAATPLVSVQIVKGSAATSATDAGDADAAFGPAVWLNGGAGTYEVWVDKTDAGAETYTLFAQCLTGANGAGVPTGTSFVGASLALGLVAGPDPVRPGDALSVELTASNLGASPVANVSLALDLPAGALAFPASLASAGGSCASSGNGDASCDPGETVSWSVGTLAAGMRKTASVPVRAAGGTSLALAARALEGASLRASANESVAVIGAPSFTLALSASADPAAPGADVVMTAAFGSLSGLPTDAALTLALPPGTSFLSATGGGSFAAGLVSWPLGLLAPGASDVRSATLRVAANAAAGTLLRSAAVVEDVTTPARFARATALGVVRNTSPLGLEIEARPDPAQPGETLDVQLTATNLGATAIDPLLELRLPGAAADFDQNFATHGGVCTASGDLDAVCGATELLRWALPLLAPGERVSVSLAPQLLAGTAAPPNGWLVPLRAELADVLAGESRWAEEVIRVAGTPRFALALDESADPAAPGSDVTYTATFGNPSASGAANALLTLTLPPGATFLSSTGGGVLGAGEVAWGLGALPEGRGGKREVTVRLDGALAAGRPLRAVARLVDVPAPAASARASAVTVVQPSAPLGLALTVSPNPAVPGAALAASLTLENSGAQALNGVVLETRVPNFIAAFPQSSATGGASCAVSGDGDAQCEARERVQWLIPSLAPGAPLNVALASSVASGAGAPSLGALIRFIGFAEGAGAFAASTLRVGAAEDADGDGISDWLDNCTNAANPSQSDTGGVGASSTPDGIGDVCQCGDVNDDGLVTGLDGTLVKRATLGLAPFGAAGVTALAAPQKCDVNGGTTGDATYHCSGLDGTIIQRDSLGLSPAVLQACLAADGN